MRKDLRSLRNLLGLLGTPWSRVLYAVTFGVLALGAAIGLSAVSAWLIARASQRPLILDLTVAVVAVRALGISRGVFRYFDRIFSHDVALRGVQNLQEETYQRLAQSPINSTIRLRRGDLLARFGADIDAIGDVVVRAVMPFLTAVVTSVASVALIAFLSPRSAVVLAICLVLAGTVAPFGAARAAYNSETATVTAQGHVAAASLSVVENADELLVSRRLDDTLAHLAVQEERVHSALRRASWPAALAPVAITLGMGVSVLGSLIIGSAEVAAGSLSAVNLAVITLTPLAVFEAIEGLPAAAVQTLRSAAAASRLEEVLDSGTSHFVRTGLKADLTGEAVIHAHDLAVGYSADRPVVSGINLTLEPGQSLAIVGASGVGKTTLLATLAGLLPPLAGSVTIRNQESAGLGLGEAAKTVVMTAEDAHIFDTTILENLRVARGQVTPKEAMEALKQAGLEEFMSRLPDGLNTRLGENATMVSGGERRRLLLARSLLADAPLMLIDEPGEHLDTATADRLTAHILAQAKTGETRRGVIVVTHREESVADADHLLRLDSTQVR